MRDTFTHITAEDFKAVTEFRPRNAGGWVTQVSFPGDAGLYYLAIPGYSQPVEVLAYQAPMGTQLATRRGVFTKRSGNWRSVTEDRDMVVSNQTVYHVLMTEFLGTV